MKYTLYISAVLAISLAACSGQKDTNIQVEALPIKATYAFEAKSNAAMIAASPNDVASWLGAVAVLGQDGTLSFSDIEANRSNAVSGSYEQVIGFDRVKAPALFAAVNRNGNWRGFVESSDTFDFSPAAVVGAPDKSSIICAPTYGAAKDSLRAITGADLSHYNISISTDGILSLSKGDTHPTKLKGVKFCSTTRDGSIIAGTDEGLSRIAPDGIGIAVAKTMFSSAAVLDEKILLAVSKGRLFEVDSETLEVGRQLSIESGLSIGGIENVGKIYVTSAAFGGIAFNDGAVFVTDADSARVVVVSRRYFLSQLQPEDLAIQPSSPD